VGVKRFLPFILLFSACTLLPFFEDFFSFLGLEDEVQYDAPSKLAAQRVSTQGSFTPAIAPNYFNGSIRVINLRGIKGTKKLPGLYHLESNAWVPEEYEWQCGLHMLYNMCEIERVFGISDISDEEFIAECVSVPTVFDKDGSYLYDLEELGYRVAACPLRIIEHDDNSDHLDFLCGSESEARFWSRVHARLNKPGVQCEHFGCFIYTKEAEKSKKSKDLKKTKKIGHIFLISVVKMPDGAMALYLLDNMNYDVSRDEQGQMYRHAKYIHDHIFG
jgi:hypothetical protein